ncbi:MAG TPA: septal ring lytic transglycosylase RlpA family protein [Solirubrobacteraceae bacterium]|jgi:rare lipoprotein A|nr:septal ring lytic transglycosylase RlpA family protein [Solirubrobacteraceae bacterium]
MRSAFKHTALLTALAAPAWLLAASASALASGSLTGGVSGAQAPTPSAHHASHKAVATWFGPGFYGQRTACGQLLTPSVLGLANRTLRCGTLVTVTYRGRHLTLPVIDRGPYGGNGAQWDLTFGAARQLGMADTARIAARVVGSAPNTPTLGSPPPVPIVASTGGISAG